MGKISVVLLKNKFDLAITGVTNKNPENAQHGKFEGKDFAKLF